ncbi:MAG: hypothetical protein KGI54_15410 [Pseudomonadota bacterium]|nr:hypothetical protein [Pseudomonadota bacterium]
MLLLIDGDLIAFRCSVVHNSSPDAGLAKMETTEMLHRIIGNLNADEYRIFLSGTENFRKDIDPDYKANRKNQARPIWLEDVREYLIQEWRAEVTDWYEADDAIGINMVENATIVSIDKDLKQIPGRHFNFVTNTFDLIDEVQARRNFYKQFLIGDVADNITGVAGIGKVKAERIIGCLYDEMDMFQTVRMYYDDDERLLKNGRLLHILRSETDEWNFPSAPSSETEPQQ